MQFTNKTISQTISVAPLRGKKREDPGDKVGVFPALNNAKRSLHLLNSRHDWSLALTTSALIGRAKQSIMTNLSLVPRRSLLIRCPREVVTSQLMVESYNDRAENGWGLGCFGTTHSFQSMKSYFRRNVPFIQKVRVLFKTRLIFPRINGPNVTKIR